MAPAPLVECEGTKDRVKKETNQQEVAVRKRWKGSGKGDPFRAALQGHSSTNGCCEFTAGGKRREKSQNGRTH